MKVFYIAHHPNDGRTEAPDGQQSQEAAARQEDTTIAARVFKVLPYPMLAFQCIGDQDLITVPRRTVSCILFAGPFASQSPGPVTML